MATFTLMFDGKEYTAEIDDTIIREAMAKGGATVVGPITSVWLSRMEGRTIDFTTLHDMAQQGRLKEVLQPFDELTFPLETGEVVVAVCAKLWPDRARLVFKDCYWKGRMNEAATNEGGYYNSEMRKRILEEIYPTLPKALRDIIAPRKIVELIDFMNVHGEQYSMEYEDPLWLPSVTDVFGPSKDGWWETEIDSYRLPIFERKVDRVKADSDGETVWWWLRSVHATGTYSFRVVSTSGSGYGSSACRSGGLALGFDIA